MIKWTFLYFICTVINVKDSTHVKHAASLCVWCGWGFLFMSLFTGNLPIMVNIGSLNSYQNFYSSLIFSSVFNDEIRNCRLPTC